MSEKQRIQGKLLKLGMVHFRGSFYATRLERLTLLIREPRRWRYNTYLANLLHRLGETVDRPEFTDLDISFLNHAVPFFLRAKANHWDTGLIELLVQFHDCAPLEVADRITWHPSDTIRERLADLERWKKDLKLSWQPTSEPDDADDASDSAR